MLFKTKTNKTNNDSKNSNYANVSRIQFWSRITDQIFDDIETRVRVNIQLFFFFFFIFPKEIHDSTRTPLFHLHLIFSDPVNWILQRTRGIGTLPRMEITQVSHHKPIYSNASGDQKKYNH